MMEEQGAFKGPSSPQDICRGFIHDDNRSRLLPATSQITIQRGNQLHRVIPKNMQGGLTVVPLTRGDGVDCGTMEVVLGGGETMLAPHTEMNNAPSDPEELFLSAEEWDAIIAEGSTSLGTPPSTGFLSRQSPAIADTTERGNPAQTIPLETNSASPESIIGCFSREKAKKSEALGSTRPAEGIILEPDFNPMLFSMALMEADHEYAHFVSSAVNPPSVVDTEATESDKAGNVEEPSSIVGDELNIAPGYEWHSNDELAQLFDDALGASNSEDIEHRPYDSGAALTEELNAKKDDDFEHVPLSSFCEPSSSTADGFFVFSQQNSIWEAYPISRTPSFSSLFGNYQDRPEGASPTGSSQIEIFVPSPAPGSEASPINSPDHDSGMEFDSSTEYDKEASEDEGMGLGYSDHESADDDMEDDDEQDTNEKEDVDSASTDVETSRSTREEPAEFEMPDDHSYTSDEDMDDSEGPHADMTPGNSTNTANEVKKCFAIPESSQLINPYVSPLTPARADSEIPLDQQNPVYGEGQVNNAHAVYPQEWEVEVDEQARILIYGGKMYQLIDYFLNSEL
ncbi:hypothetical protein DFP73DRAFT_525310 [Morchella snyderi]|nr:hypothetical protein DFP73DRAFT_525310 [Morchella snyderi]